MKRHTLVLAAVLTVAALVVPLSAAGAATTSAKANGPVVKIGVLLPINSPTAANPDNGDAFKAAVAAFNKRGGLGKKHSRIQAFVCDTRGDSNGEVNCARELVSDGVVATVGDLAYNNPAGVVSIMEGAQIPRIGLFETDLAEFTSAVSFTVNAGPVADYVAAASGLAKEGKKKVTLVRTDAPTGASFKGFVQPPFQKADTDIVGDIAIATGSTDYSPYVAQLQRSGANSAVLAIDEQSASQLVASMAQLNAKIRLSGISATFSLNTLRKFNSVTKGTLLVDSFPYPSQNNVKNFPGLKQFYADMKASGKKNLQPTNIKPAAIGVYMAVLSFVKLVANLDTITKDTVLQALKTEKDINLNGLAAPWTPSAPGYSLFKSSSNHIVFLSKWDGKNVVTQKTPVDITPFFPSS